MGASLLEADARLGGQVRVDGLSGGTAQLHGALIMMGDHLGVVLGASEGRQPACGPTMLLGALRPWYLAVRDVAHQHVQKAVLGLRGSG